MSAEGTGMTRREAMASGGLVVAFALAGPAAAQEGAGEGLPGDLAKAPRLDSWIRIGPDGAVTVLTGKAELGQGLKTAIVQVAAEELVLEPDAVGLVTADTGATPDEGYTAGSASMAEGATAVRLAAANVRVLLLEEAARRLNAATDDLTAANGEVRAPDGRALAYGDLAAGIDLAVRARPDAPLIPPGRHRVIGRDAPRRDLPAKLAGRPAYVQDLRLPGMVHARLVRPPSPGARLASLDPSAVEAMSGVVRVHHDGDYLAVVAESEWGAVLAMRALAEAARWEERDTLPRQAELPAALKRMAEETGVVDRAGEPTPPTGARTIRLAFTRPYGMHGAIGPSCAVGLMEGDHLTVWTHTQGVHPDRAAIAELLGMPPERVRLVHVEGSGCYGHNGADDAAADAALLARALPGRPVRVQWTREQEHAHEPFGPAMVVEVEAALDGEGRLSHWRHELWSNTHVNRPGGADALLPAQLVADARAPRRPGMRITRSGNADRNAVPLYDVPNREVLWHFVREMLLRVSALRALGAYANVFAIESAVDELARLAGADPVAFRLRHLSDPRARAVVERTASAFGWEEWRPAPGRGRGLGFARYKNLAAYCAVAVEVEVAPETGEVRVRRAHAAIDSGEAISPGGIRNQTEGGILQSMSWTLLEQVDFSERRVTSIDWSSYPILRFGRVPARVEVEVVDRPGEPFLGTGEAAQGPTAAAIANALRDATGARLTNLPLSPERVRGALATGTRTTETDA